MENSNIEENDFCSKEFNSLSNIYALTMETRENYTKHFNFIEILNFIKKSNFQDIFDKLDTKAKLRIKSKDEKFWNLKNVNLTKENILYILGLAGKSNCLNKIVFCNFSNRW